MYGDVADFWDLQSLNFAQIFSMPFNSIKSFQIPIENYGGESDMFLLSFYILILPI